MTRVQRIAAWCAATASTAFTIGAIIRPSLRTIVRVTGWCLTLGLLAIFVFAIVRPSFREWLVAPVTNSLTFGAIRWRMESDGTITVTGDVSGPARVTLLVDGLDVADEVARQRRMAGVLPPYQFSLKHVRIDSPKDRIYVIAAWKVSWATLRTRSDVFSASVEPLPVLEVPRSVTSDQLPFRGRGKKLTQFTITAGATEVDSPRPKRVDVTSDDTGAFAGMVQLPVSGNYRINVFEKKQVTRTAMREAFVTRFPEEGVDTTKLAGEKADPLKKLADAVVASTAKTPIIGPYHRRLDCDIALDDARFATQFDLPEDDVRLAEYRAKRLNFGELFALVFGTVRVNELTLSELFSRTTPTIVTKGSRVTISAASPPYVYSVNAYPAIFHGYVAIVQDTQDTGILQYRVPVDDTISVTPHGFKIASWFADDPYELDHGTYVLHGTGGLTLPRYIRFSTATVPWAGAYELQQVLASTPTDFAAPSERAATYPVEDVLAALFLCIPAGWALTIVWRRSRVPLRNPGDAAIDAKLAGVAWYAIAIAAVGPAILMLFKLIYRSGTMSHEIGPNVWIVLTTALVVAVASTIMAGRSRALARAAFTGAAIWGGLSGWIAFVALLSQLFPIDTSPRQVVVDTALAMPVLTALIGFASLTLTVISNGAVPRIPVVGAVLVGALLAIPTAYVGQSVALRVDGVPTSFDALEPAWTNAIWIIRPLFAVCFIAWLSRARPISEAERLQIATLLFASYVAGSTRVIYVFPVYLVAAALIFRRFLVAKKYRSLSASENVPPPAPLSPAMAKSLRDVIDDAERQQIYGARQALWDGLIRGSINPKEYKERKEAVEQILLGADRAPDAAPESTVRSAALEEGRGADDYENGRIAARWSIFLIIGFLALSFRSFVNDIYFGRPYPFLGVASDIGNSVVDIGLAGFAFGYAFRLIRGRTGLRKAFWTFCAVLMSVGVSWVLGSSRPISLFATIVLMMTFYLVLGGVAFDMIVLKQAREKSFRWIDLIYAQGRTRMLARVSTILALIVLVGTSLGSVILKELLPEVTKALAPSLAPATTSVATGASSGATSGFTSGSR